METAPLVALLPELQSAAWTNLLALAAQRRSAYGRSAKTSALVTWVNMPLAEGSTKR